MPRLALLVGLVLCLSPGISRAAAYNWNQPGPLWNSSGSWTPVGAAPPGPPAAADTANFLGGFSDVDLNNGNAGTVVDTILFGAGSTAYRIINTFNVLPASFTDALTVSTSIINNGIQNNVTWASMLMTCPLFTVNDGTNVFTGTNFITFGTVNINGPAVVCVQNFGGVGSVTATTWNVNSGGTLKGSGTTGGPGSYPFTFVGNVQVNAGGTMQAGCSVGTLDLQGNLTFAAGSVSDFELSQPNVVGGGNDLFNVAGNLTLNGTINLVTLPGFGPGVYRLFNYTGALNNNGVALAGVPSGYMAQLDFTTTNQVNLLVSPVILSYTNTILPGLNLIANQLDHGNNHLSEVLENVPEGSQMSFWNSAAQQFTTYYYEFGAWEPADPVFGAYQAAFLFNPESAAYDLHMTGVARANVPPPPALEPERLYYLSGPINAPARYEDITGRAPTQGTEFIIWNAVSQKYQTNRFNGGAWQPSEPVAAVGQGVVLRQVALWPLMTCQDVVANCMNDTGAIVNYPLPDVTTLPGCGPISMNCFPPQGWFPIGITPVTCIALDNCGNYNFCTFNVVVKGFGAGVWKWAQQALPGSTSTPSGGNGIAVDHQGNVFVVGGYMGTLGFPNILSPVSLAPFGAEDVFLAKYDTAGVLQWAVRAGGSGSDAGNGVAVDADGNAYITGEFTGTAMFPGYGSLTAGGPRDAFIAKYSKYGTCLWAKNSGSFGAVFGTAIAIAPTSGNVLVTGGVEFYGKEEAFLQRLDANGGYLNKQILTTGSAAGHYAHGSSLAVAANEDVYVAGEYAETTVFGGNNIAPAAVGPSLARIFVAKCTSFGSGINLTTALRHSSGNGASVSHGVPSLALDEANGKVYVSGIFNGTANFGGTPLVNTKNGSLLSQFYDYFIAKFDTVALAPVWAIKGADNPGNGGNAASDDETRGIVLNLAGNPCVTGFIRPNAPSPYINEGPTMLVASYSAASGALLWLRNATDGTSGPAAPEDIGRSIAVDRAGCVHVTGQFTEDLEFQPVATLTALPRTLFVGKICPECSGNCVTKPSNLTLWLPLDETTGTTAQNLAAPFFPGTHVNGPTPSAGSYVGNSLCFDGVDDFVQVPTYPAIEIGPGAVGQGEFTVDAWIKADSNNTKRTIVEHRKPVGANFTGYALFLWPDNSIGFDIGDGFNPPSSITSTLKVPLDGGWHFVAAVVKRTGNSSTFYMDNLSQMPNFPNYQASLTLGIGVPLLIGGSAGGLFKGCLDEVELFDRALTGAEIQSLYQASRAGKCKPPCLGCQIILNSPQLLANSIILRWSGGAPGHSVTVEASANLTDWTTVATPPTGANEVELPVNPGQAARFFRLRGPSNPNP